MRASLVLVLFATACVGRATHHGTTPIADESARDVRIAQPVLRAYVQTLHAWMTPDERARLLAVGYQDTERGDPQRLRYLAADHVIRHLLPRALEARRDPTLDTYAAALRRLPPLLDEDTDAVAAPVVRLAMQGLRRALNGEPVLEPRARDARPIDTTIGSESARDTSATQLVDDMLPEIDPEAEAAVAEALASYSQAFASRYGVSALEADAMAAAASDVVDTGLLFERAVAEWGLTRDVVVEEALVLAGAMSRAAARRERLPRRPRPQPSQIIPPDAPGSPTRP